MDHKVWNVDESPESNSCLECGTPELTTVLSVEKVGTQPLSRDSRSLSIFTREVAPPRLYLTCEFLLPRIDDSQKAGYFCKIIDRQYPRHQLELLSSRSHVQLVRPQLGLLLR
jgi:hypothetical protein